MYKALYRKWRPLTFDDVISQQQVTDTLKNQILTGRTAHAYLFTGSRGTGKTTCARILAKAVNCPNMVGGNPCLECEICREADNGTLTDIVEIDAASNNGVDDIRELRDGAVYSPEKCRFKVYIIDEVHMLSVPAFNAMLKIMEEPPPYVKFILATTEIQKVPATILSRCQRYDFRRIRPKDIASRLMFIASQENISLSQEGADLIAKIADGGMRDAVSLLDQCSVRAENITADTVSETAGLASRDYLYELLDAVSAGDTSKALNIVSTLHDMSKDLQRLCEELILQLRNIMLLKASPDTAEDMIVCLPEEMDRLRNLAENSSLDDIMFRIGQLQSAYDRMRYAMNRRVELEMSLIRICSGAPAVQSSAAVSPELIDKIKFLEKKLSQIQNSPANPGNAPENNGRISLSVNSPAPEMEPKPTVDLRNIDMSQTSPCQRWGEVVEEMRRRNPSLAACLENSYASTIGNVIFITAVNPMFIELIKKIKENAIALNVVINDVLGQRFIVRSRCETTVEEQKNMAEALINKAKNSQIDTAVDNNSN
ncbi:MAG: DNA polymerase III subunit gamma/tau [Ruminococcus sp.]|nr:DNA polymerase III subunit gamma/tau [Ruminococcus sp.]